jgi:rhamnogalacturonyl hydrolase YesR
MKFTYIFIIPAFIISCLENFTFSQPKVQKDEAAQETQKYLENVISHFFESHNFFLETSDVHGNYTLDISIESILDYSSLTEDTTYTSIISGIFQKRGYNFSDTIPYKRFPFSNPYFAWYRVQNNPEFIAPFIFESNKMRTELVRTNKGAICINHNGGNYMLIDFLQEYASRMAKTGYLTGDTLFFKECVEQFRIYREILQDKNSGLYSQGRGWLEDRNQISPGIWSRGQGWLIRGMVTSLMYMPSESHYYKELRDYLVELADGLLKKQDEQGMWHALLHLPFSGSYPETSGTGMIAGYLAIAYHKGILADEKYKNAARKAVKGLIPYIDKNGALTYVSKGPGPLRSIEDYTIVGTDEHHGTQAVIYALTGLSLLEKMDKK